MNATARLVTSAFQQGRPPVAYVSPAEARAFETWSERTIVTWYRSRWLDALERRFNEITSLQRGWDGYRGVPVSFSCAAFAAEILERLYLEPLPPPALVPGSDGSVQIEWHREGYDIEIDVLAPNNVVATRYDHATEQDESIEIVNDFTLVASWVRDMVGGRQEIAAATL